MERFDAVRALIGETIDAEPAELNGFLGSPACARVVDAFVQELQGAWQAYCRQAPAAAQAAAACPATALATVSDVAMPEPAATPPRAPSAELPAPPAAVAPTAEAVLMTYRNFDEPIVPTARTAGDVDRLAPPPAGAAPATANAGPAPVPTPVPTSPGHTAIRPGPPRRDARFHLPNARAGEPYRASLQPAPAPAIRILSASIAADSGLAIEADGLCGTPARAGEFEFEVLYHFADEDAACRRRSRVTLLVNADPKTLWKDLPSARTAAFWKEDAACRQLAGPDYRLVAASKRGRSHAHVGACRDDDFYVRHTGASGWYVAALADGAGSARFSRRGSQIACTVAGEHLANELDGRCGEQLDALAAALHREGSGDPGDAAASLLHRALFTSVGYAAYYALQAIQAEPARCGEPGATLRDFSTTLIATASKRYPFGTLCAAYWVGDGAVAAYRRSGEVVLLGAVDSGEFSGQTRFLEPAEVVQDALLRRVRFTLVDDLQALILMTDGVSDPEFDTEQALSDPARWQTLWRKLAADRGPLHGEPAGVGQRLLDWLDFWSVGNHDDRTIAVLY